MKTNETKFTEKQLADWLDYEEVRSGGCYNMFDPRARQATGLTGDEYSFVMQNYSQLKAVANGKEANK